MESRWIGINTIINVVSNAKWAKKEKNKKKRSRHIKLYEKRLGGKLTVTLFESTSCVNVLES